MGYTKRDRLEQELLSLEVDLKREELEKSKAERQHEELRLKQTKLELDMDTTQQKWAKRETAIREFRRKHRTLVISGIVSEKMAQYMRSDLLTWEFEDKADKVKTPAPVTVLINSPGGYVIPGLDMYDLIMEYRAKGWEINTKVTGMAMSMAGVLLQAGERREMTPRSTFMLHEVASYAEGKVSDMEDQLKFTKDLQLHCSKILSSRSKISTAEVEKLWGRRDIFLTAEDTLKKGFIDGIAELCILHCPSTDAMQTSSKIQGTAGYGSGP